MVLLDLQEASRNAGYRRFLSVIVLALALEVLALKFVNHAHAVLPLDGVTWWPSTPGVYWGRLADVVDATVKVAGGALVFWLVWFSARFYKDRSTHHDTATAQPARGGLLALHLLAWLVFAGARGILSSTYQSPVPVTLAGLTALYLASFAALLVSGAALLAPLAVWRHHVHRHGRPFAAIVGLAACGLALSQLHLGAETWLLQYHEWLFPPTARAVMALLHVAGYAVRVDMQTTVMGVKDFEVEIQPACLGYEGVSISMVAVSLLLFVCRKSLKFPLALLILPAVFVAMFFGNALRLALLLAIGASWSPDVAMAGFHSVGGWLNLSMVLGLAFLAVTRLPLFNQTPTRFSFDLSGDQVQLVPQLTLIAVALLSLLVSPGFEWAYPLRVVIVGALVFAWRAQLVLHGLARSQLGLPILIGTVVFLIWVALVPEDPEKSSVFARHLASVPPGWVVCWLAFRVVGAVLVVPAAEELAFRGFLWTRLASASATGVIGPRLAPWLTLALTSLAFGLLHSAWFAGTLAGLAYGLLRHLRGHVMGAVVAHSVTNLLLAGYVLQTRAWSLW